MYPHRFEDRTASYPKWPIAVRGSVTYAGERGSRKPVVVAFAACSEEDDS